MYFGRSRYPLQTGSSSQRPQVHEVMFAAAAGSLRQTLPLAQAPVDRAAVQDAKFRFHNYEKPFQALSYAIDPFSRQLSCSSIAIQSNPQDSRCYEHDVLAARPKKGAVAVLHSELSDTGQGSRLHAGT